MATLTIDLIPYDVDLTNGTICVREVRGSVLAMLDNRKETTGTRSSEDRCYTKISNSWCRVTYDTSNPEDHGDIIIFTPCPGQAPPTFDDFVEWLSDNFDRIQSIGWEMLKETI